uniref:Sulfotransferase domain-containing protein n=1 Tax=Glossina pallidipes TaxID=7398 RepID=A0A1A9ZSW1_GLOPL
MELKYQELDKAIAERIDAMFPKKNCFISVSPGNVILPRQFMNIGESIRNLKTYTDDVWLVSYPRTGSTWAQEMVWLLGNHLNYEQAKQMQQLRAPLIELSALYSEDHHEWVSNSLGDTVDVVRKMRRPRFARSHLPWHLLPVDLENSKAKIVYTARNPKDLCVSFYYYCKLMHGLQGTFEDFLGLFLNESAPIGSYWKHVLPFWKRSTEPNVLFLKYEDMKRDLPSIVRKCAKFLQIDYQISETDLRRICDHLKFDKMQKNPAVNLEPLLSQTDINGNGVQMANNSYADIQFIRKGEIGDWKNYITTEMSQRFDEWIDQNTRGSGLSFDYE